MSHNKVQYEILPNGCGFYAKLDNKHIGQITFVKIGIDKLMIERTFVEQDYQKFHILFNLVYLVVNLARNQQRKILNRCPFAQNVFIGHPEFDDALLMHAH